VTELTQAEIEQLRSKETAEEKPTPEDALADEAMILT
jgi:hypothetical protein